jgi:hypothetical protein
MPAPADVPHAIEETLERHAKQEAGRIHLDVQDGRVTVSGIVHSWAEKQAVLGPPPGRVGFAGWTTTCASSLTPA